ncbi:hypothetical protein BC833DRAFT_611440 [Globomyces pollinis-pini]|nr:hypothetical protein BC833DRAFT_611440 [Globomyces pollinis-pini]
MSIKSVVFEEVNPLYNPSKNNQPVLKDKFFFIVRTTDVKTYTIQYFDAPGDNKPGEIKITNGAAKFLEMVRALEFDTDPSVAYSWKDFENWLFKRTGYHETVVSKDHNQYSFVQLCVDRLTAKCARPLTVERVASLIPLNVHDPTSKDIEIFAAVRSKLENQVEHLKKRDEVHKTELTKECHIKSYELVASAEHPVLYGTIYFGKILIGDVYIHARAHQFRNGDIEYHSLDTTRYSCVWKKEDPLVFFDY